MIVTKLLGNELKKLGFDFYSGVPCSFLKSLINYAINECTYLAAANEGDGVAIAAGAFLGGKKSVVLMQNSGLCNAISPLTSLNYPFKLPVLGFVSLRGEEGLGDEPQHELMGQITINLLENMKINYEYLSGNFQEAKKQLQRANEFIEKNMPFFFVVKKGTFHHEVLQEEKRYPMRNTMEKPKINQDQLPSRYETLHVINSLKDNQTVQLATTGKTGRELYEIEDGVNNLYLVGSMGCISSLGLGLALTRKDKDIVVLDGDGSLLMHMGSLAVNGYYHPPNMLHILLDNNSYDSTGGQSAVTHNVNFVKMAASFGYDNAIYVHNLGELETYINAWKKEKKITFMYIKIAKGSKQNLGRPNIKPYEVKERLQAFLGN